MGLGALAFLNPLALGALAALPVIYWLLRTVPPRPRQLEFPPTRILVGLENREKTPAKTPWWLLLIRMLAATLIILALAEPVLNPDRNAPIPGRGPVVVVVDNGWTAGSRWAERLAVVEQVIAEAEGQSRPVAVVPTAATTRAPSVRVEAPSQAKATARALQPQPFAPDRSAAVTALEQGLAAVVEQGLGVVYLTDGVDHDGKSGELLARLQAIAERGGGGLILAQEARDDPAVGIEGRITAAGQIEARVVRSGGPAGIGTVLAQSARGDVLATGTYAFDAGSREAKAAIELPLELRNQVNRLVLAGQSSAGAVSLLDQRSQWQRIGLVSGESSEQAQPLLAPFYYIEKALAPTAEIVKPRAATLDTSLEEALTAKVSVLALADIGTLPDEMIERLQKFMESGGVLLRFAGPRLEKGGDKLLPVPLRIGGRTLGGALSWSTPQKLTAFEDQSLFAGLAIPDEVTVTRQVLADPSRLGPDVLVWARLADGTPLVTARRVGDGLVVLFHITGNSDWSNLPLSGLFVEMLKRVAAQGRVGGAALGAGAGEPAASGASGATAAASGVLAPIATLDGYGKLGSPPPMARALTPDAIAALKPNLEHPPGYYGSRGAPVALNVVQAGDALEPLPAPPSGTALRASGGSEESPLKPSMLTLALALLAVDMLAILMLQAGGLGALFSRSRGAASAAAPVRATSAVAALAMTSVALLALAGAPVALAQPTAATDAKAQIATSNVTLGYVLTGDAEADEASRQGLAGLARVLQLRTAVTPGEPLAVDIVKDEIAFYPVLYWPVPERATALPRETLAKIDAYMKQGGMIIFDTRDHGRGGGLGIGLSRDGETPLQRIIGALDLPRLEPVPDGHVLTKSFYLLRSFPGRWDGGQLWVEAGGVAEDETGRQARRADGVTSILVTSNDLASAWALDARGRPLYPTVPGGEVQREMAFRAGINIVMHALTGNYKADQVHVPALLERLGQ
ncbi:MAG: DUF4159 domain-containing protein [Hyphomicrobiaceae bacterium]|nr:DUF4159 domain-containing protein [Hyphomicrobiaceae bacterium]